MAQPKVSPHGDFTGKQKAKLLAEHQAAEQEKNAAALAQAQADEEFRANSTVDLTGGAPIILDGDDVQELDGTDELDEATFKTIRVNQDIEQMTVGAGNTYDFNVGQKYRVPIHIAEHLEEKGLVWH